MHVGRADSGPAPAAVEDLGTCTLSTGEGARAPESAVRVQMAGGELIEILGEFHLPAQDVPFTGGALLTDADERLQQLKDGGCITDGVPGHRGAGSD